jgi:outer membrane receptor for ferrienterochelin and colicins
MTFQKSEYKELQQWSDNENLIPHKQIFRSPDHYGYLTANYQVIKNMNISLSGTYTGSMLVQHFAGYVPEDTEKRTSDFYDLNFKLSYDFRINSSTRLQLNGGVQNIFDSYQNDFDKGEFRDAGYIYGPALPRTSFFGLKIII